MIKLFKAHVGIYSCNISKLSIINILIINISYAFYPAKNRYLPDFMYSYVCQTYWDPNIHIAPTT